MRVQAWAVATTTAGMLMAPPAHADPGSIVPPAAIDDLMVTPQEASSVLGVGFPTVNRLNALPDLSTDRPDCGSVIRASIATYDRAPYMAAHDQQLEDAAPWTVQVSQSVAVFPSDDEARDFASSEMDLWQRCANQTVRDGFQWRYMISALRRDDDAIVGPYVMIADNGVRKACTHLLVRVRNTVTDMRTCSDGPERYERVLRITRIIGPRYEAA